MDQPEPDCTRRNQILCIICQAETGQCYYKDKGPYCPEHLKEQLSRDCKESVRKL